LSTAAEHRAEPGAPIGVAILCWHVAGALLGLVVLKYHSKLASQKSWVGDS